MSRKDETVERRAVKIAAQMMRVCGLCRYDSVDKCRRVWVDESTCDACIEQGLLTAARRELKKEGRYETGG